jgi:hypothetical protein
MGTPKQIAASRANGARSKGPVTPEGKRTSSRNSTRHGMFADTLVLEKENTAQFHELLNELLDEHQPSTRTQMMLVETIVAARWRQQRIWGIQKTNFDYDIASVEIDSENPALRAVMALRTNDESIRSHELLLRFEIALDRQISRALLRLQKLQEKDERRKKESPDLNPDPQEAENTIPPERTQQPAETKPPATATQPNTRRPRTPEPPQDVQCPAKLPVPSALLPGDVRFKRVRS